MCEARRPAASLWTQAAMRSLSSRRRPTRPGWDEASCQSRPSGQDIVDGDRRELLAADRDRGLAGRLNRSFGLG